MPNIIAPVDSATYLFPDPTMVALDARYASTSSAASGVSFTPTGTIAATTVQAAIVEVRNESVAAPNGSVRYLGSGAALPTIGSGTQAGDIYFKTG